MTIPVDSPDALLDVHRIPRKIKVEENSRKLEVYAFTAGGGADQNAWPILLAKTTFCGNLGSVIAAAKHYYTLTWERLFNFSCNQIHGAKVGSEYNNLLVWVLSPQRAEAVEQFLRFCLALHRETAEQLSDTETLFWEMQFNYRRCSFFCVSGRILTCIRVRYKLQRLFVQFLD